VGDPRQNQPVGAGGLWDQIHQAVDEGGAHVQLTRNQRARDPADQRDQALLRQGEIEHAIRGYQGRDRVHLHPDQQRAEDQALDAAHADRAAGKTTVVIAQTSNDHLDELNARAQAIRQQSGQLGGDSVPVPGRPYRLHTGDQIQIRHTIQHPDHGTLRNGTIARITEVNPRTGELELRVVDGAELRLDDRQTATADLRLGYVQHPFPAQGQTTDTTHVIIGDHATREGSYVAITRARDHTHIYAADITQTGDLDSVHQLAERVSHTEPDLPSIHTPLAHETELTGYNTMQHAKPAQPVQAINATRLDTGHQHSFANHDLGRDTDTAESPLAPEHEPGEELATDAESPGRNGADRPELGPIRERTETTNQPPVRTWPRTPDRELRTHEHDNALEPDHIGGREP